MKSLYHLSFTFAAACLMVACSSDNTVTETTNTKDSTLTETIKPEDNSADQINLNDGAKWKVDEHMLGFIRSIETDVNEFSNSAGEKALDAYHHLSEKVSSNLDSLTSNCTMTGQAHDELHKWLLPFLDLSDYFSASETVAEADSLFKEISVSFQEFNTYFE